ncbi:MAG: DUF6597 domain-containing transcriptional factor [Granulosicoccus sp.]
MYDPVKDGVDKTVDSVSHSEARPPEALRGLVHSFWELKTERPLASDLVLHAVPDACVNILFNQLDTDIAGITALRTTYEALNLGREFHYVGIQLLPGAWQGNQNETTDKFVGTPYTGDLPLAETSRQMAGLEFSGKQALLAALAHTLIDAGIVSANVVTEKVLPNIDRIQTVSDMAEMTHLSSRQLQRKLKQLTGFSPHNLLKVLRLQQSFKHHYLETYADQSHFIHSFRKITGYTPAQYYRKFNV